MQEKNRKRIKINYYTITIEKYKLFIIYYKNIAIAVFILCLRNDITNPINNNPEKFMKHITKTKHITKVSVIDIKFF